MAERIIRRDFLSKFLLPLTAALTASCTGNQISQQPEISSVASTGFQVNQRRGLPARINGIHLPSWSTGEYQSANTQRSLQNLSNINPNLIGISPVLYQENIYSADIRPTGQTAGDTDLKFIIDKAHQLGYAVMLAPRINLSNDPNQWHGNIGEGFTEAKWRSWFSSYRQMINHYAQLSQQSGVELFVAGNEYYQAALSRPDDWISTIEGVRDLYSGPLTYAAHMYSFEAITWWPKLDLVGVNPYFQLTNKNNPTPDELRASWRQIANRLEAVSKKWKKGVIFPEIGYPSADGANKEPWNYKLASDPNVLIDTYEQSNCIQALYGTLSPRSWWRGVVWWHWDINSSGGLLDKDYTPEGKPAANVISAYGKTLEQNS